MKTFKKYANRKLYSSERKSYVTIKDILSHVKQGERVQVISHVDGRDVTDQVIREAIMRSSELSTEKLVEMVRGQ